MRTALCRPLFFVAVVASFAATAMAQQAKSNQTQGYGAGMTLTFTYTQNFDCVDQPNTDLTVTVFPPIKIQEKCRFPSARSAHNPPSIRLDRSEIQL